MFFSLNYNKGMKKLPLRLTNNIFIYICSRLKWSNISIIPSIKLLYNTIQYIYNTLYSYHDFLTYRGPLLNL